MNRAWLAAAVWCAGLAACAAGQDAKGPYAQPLGGGTVRFFESEEAFNAAPTASFVLESQRRPAFTMPEGFPLIPEFGAAGETRTITIKAPPGVSFYGLGMAAGPMLRNGFTSGDAPVECPWVMGVRPDGTAFGVLPDTSYACRVDLTNGVVITTDAPHPGVIVFDAADPHELLVNLNQATGRMEMPPRWALGAAALMPGDSMSSGRRWRERKIPVDGAIVPGVFGARRAAGESHDDLIRSLADEGFHAMTVVGPWVRVNAGEPLYESGQAIAAWILTVDGKPLDLPPASVSPDFTRSPVREWWARTLRRDAPLDGLMLLAPPRTFPPTSRFRADTDLGGESSQYDGIYGNLCLRATRESFDAERRDKRPVLMSGLSIPPAQRWAVVQLPPFAEHADAHVRGGLSVSLSGMPLISAGIPDASLAARRGGDFVGVDALMPVVTIGSVRFDGPASLAEPAAEALRSALSRRSRLIPYYYTLCFYAFRDCEPILRPLFFADPKDQSLRDRDDAFFIGADLLAVPKLDKDGPKPACPLPGGWRKVAFGEGCGDDQPDLPDLYLRPGAILPLGPVMQYTSEKPLDPLTLIVNLDESGVAVGSLYEDDGDGYAFYRNQARRIGYKAERKDGAVFIRLSNLDGGMPLPRRKLEVRILTDAGELTAIGSERGTIKIDLPKDPPDPPKPPEP